MTWWLLILLYASPTEHPEMMGAWKTEKECRGWFLEAEKTGDVPDVVEYKCIPVKARRRPVRK